MNDMVVDTSQKDKPEKLTFNDVSDFKFNAAYMAYSKVWDNNSSDKIRSKLNSIMLQYSRGEIDASSFYYNINSFKSDSESVPNIESRIKTQNKYDWRKKEQRKSRLSRYKK